MNEIEREEYYKEIKRKLELRERIAAEYNEKIKLENPVYYALVSNVVSLDEVSKMSYEELIMLRNFGAKKIASLYNSLKDAGYDVSHIIFPLTKEHYIEELESLIEKNFIINPNESDSNFNQYILRVFLKQIKKMTIPQLKSHIKNINEIIKKTPPLDVVSLD